MFELLCARKTLGGLGFKEFNKMNKALLTKQVWRLIQEPSSYWATTLKSIHFPNSEFWNANSRNGTSWVWKGLLIGRNY